MVVREVFETIRESCFSLFREIVTGLDLDDNIKFVMSPMQMIFANGSRIIFRGLDKPSKLKSINDISLIWIEECSEIKYEGFKELLGRLRNPHLALHVILSTNPVSRSNWTYVHFFEKRGVDDLKLYKERIICEQNTYYHHSTVDDNLFLADDYREQLEDMKNYDLDLYRIARLGQFGINGVRVLPQFEIQSHGEVMKAVEKIPRRYKFVGMDFGFVESYNAVVRMAVDNENKWLYLYWEYYKNRMTDDETADALQEFVRTRELIKADSAEPKAIRYYQKRGFNMVAAQKWNGGTRHARLDNTRKVKRFRRIICSDACNNCIKELAELTYAKDKDGKIIEDEFTIDSHCLSAIWYGLDAYDVTNIKYSIPREELGF